MNRRGFLGSILAACAAPAIVRADSLMRIVPMDDTLVLIHPARYRQIIGATVIVPSTIDEIVRTTLRSRAPELIRQISQRTALLKQMERMR